MLSLPRRKRIAMKRFKTKAALLLLAVYLPMWLLSSFHTHAYPLKDNPLATERQSSEVDEDGCLLCQFQQLVYEEAPQVAVAVNMPQTKVEPTPMEHDVVSAFEQPFSSRAPPVLL